MNRLQARQQLKAEQMTGRESHFRSRSARTAPGQAPQPMLIDQLNSLSQMAGAADRRVGRSALEYS